MKVLAILLKIKPMLGQGDKIFGSIDSFLAKG